MFTYSTSFAGYPFDLLRLDWQIADNWAWISRTLGGLCSSRHDAGIPSGDNLQKLPFISLVLPFTLAVNVNIRRVNIPAVPRISWTCFLLVWFQLLLLGTVTF